MSQLFKRSDQSPFIMAGPCSAESASQVQQTAEALSEHQVNLFRAGVWKPRTRPGTFEGVGEEGLQWLSDVRTRYDLPVTTEVANARHVEAALKYDIDVLWLGARTTANPFSVQEIAEALRGTTVPILIKNPINPDLQLWLGAIERVEQSGSREVGLIHRGFSFFSHKKYRNSPLWQIPIDVRTERPDLMMICDISHIGGQRSLLREVGQVAMDLAFDGLMIEVHPTPETALSDPEQQVNPRQFVELLHGIVYRHHTLDSESQADIEQLRQKIDQLDKEMISRVARRMDLARRIGVIKEEHGVPVLQPLRWRKILLTAIENGVADGLTAEFIEELFKAIHQESIHHQLDIMNRKRDNSSK